MDKTNQNSKFWATLEIIAVAHIFACMPQKVHPFGVKFQKHEDLAGEAGDESKTRYDC